MEPRHCINVIQMVELLENFYDRIDFPQSATLIRSFHKAPRWEEPLEKVQDSSAISQQRGLCGTLLIHVRYRQNSSWQGELFWMEGECHQEFVSVLMNNDLEAFLFPW